MNKIFQVFIWFGITLSTSCVEDVLVEVEPAEERLVISSLFIPDSIIFVTVTRSFSALSAENLEGLEEDLINTLLVDRARVTVTSKGQSQTLTRLSPGVYIGSLNESSPLDLFFLDVYDSTRDISVSSQTHLAPQVRFDSVGFSLSLSGTDTSSVLYYQFRDRPNEDNWYLVQGFETPTFANPENVEFDINNGEVTLKTDTSNQVFFQPNANILFTTLISDLTLESDTVSNEVTLDFLPRDTVIFVLINIDQGYYDFLQARRRSGGIITSLTSEPVNHPSNIQGGYGYFTMHLPHFKAYIMKEE